MRIVVHDYAGHPFQVQLSRQLSKRGHDVTHMYNADNHGPKGQFTITPADVHLRFSGISPGKVKQTNFMGRFVNDRVYGQKAAKAIHSIKPDVVLCGNTPVESQRAIMKTTREINARFVYWVQDVYGVAMVKLLSRKLGFSGKVAGQYFQRVDHKQFRQSDAIIVISQGFLPEVAPWARKDVAVIENWASTEEISTGDKVNSWSQQHGLDKKFVYLYSGTLGRKHNSAFLLELAKLCDPSQSVAIVGQGVGKDQLTALPSLPDSLKMLPLQPMEMLPNVLATADVLMATIEADAGQFAVPSKIQSYLCSGRPILLAAPANNAAAQNVIRANAGLVISPSDQEGFLRNAKLLFENADLRMQLGKNGRAYAEKVFDIDRITDQFEAVLVSL